MFESQYDDEMAAEVQRIEARQRAMAAGHPEWVNACADCAGELASVDTDRCDTCLPERRASSTGPDQHRDKF
jgi:hypothetical protein